MISRSYESEYLDTIEAKSTVDDIRVEEYDETTFKVTHKEAPVLQGYFDMDDDGEITPGIITKACHLRQFNEVCEFAIKEYLIEQERQERGYAYRFRFEDETGSHEYIEWTDEDADWWLEEFEDFECSLISWEGDHDE